MAKVKKMFGGGMSGMAPARGSMAAQGEMAGRAMGARMGGAGGMPTQSRMQAQPQNQKLNTARSPGAITPQKFLTPEHYKQAEALYKQKQQQQQSANSVGSLPPAGSGLKSLDPAQFAAMQKAQQGTSSAAADAGASKAYADMQAQKSGAAGAGSQTAFKKGGSVKETKKMFGGGMSGIANARGPMAAQGAMAARGMGGMGGMGMRGRMAAKPAAKPAAKAAAPAPAAPATMKKGGDVKESKKMVGKELAFMKKKGAPKSMMKHEAAEMGAMKKGGKVKKMASGGLAAGHKSADGIASKGKTKAKQVKMAYGGKC